MVGIAVICTLLTGMLSLARAESVTNTLYISVGDPLAKENACDCVKGYAQRDYHALGKHLSRQLKRPVEVVFAAGVAAAELRCGEKPHLVIQKVSVARADFAAVSCKASLIAMLSGLDGVTTLHGLFVVPKASPIRSLLDLGGKRLMLGPADSEEKNGAALKTLAEPGVKPAAPLLEAPSCNAAAGALARGEADVAVISSYAKPLIVACGAAEEGELRVIGRTDPVPFVGVFATDRLSSKDQALVCAALLDSITPELMTALESSRGFVVPAVKGADESAITAGWVDWRGTRARDGLSCEVPRVLPETAKILWRRSLEGQSLGGIAATPRQVILSDKTAAGDQDIWRCLDAADGNQLWEVRCVATQTMDYTSAPRATPLIDGDKAFLLGALGDLVCVDAGSGKVGWRVNLVKQFGGKVPTWGFCGTPLMAGWKIVVQTGAREHGLVALNRRTGEKVWESPGSLPGYGSHVLMNLGGRDQIVGHDEVSLGGWEPESGKRLWTVVPPNAHDFNIPTPLKVGDMLLVSTEHNGSRLFVFDEKGMILKAPVSSCEDLSPDMSSPVVVNGRVWGMAAGVMHVMSMQGGLKQVDELQFDGLGQYASLIGGNNRVLASSVDGALYLFDADADGKKKPVKLQVLESPDGQVDMWSFPALVGDRIYLRNHKEIVCLMLK